MIVAATGVHFSGRTEALCFLVGEIVYVYYFVLLWKRSSVRLLALLPLLVPSLVVPWRGPTGRERILYTFVFIWNMGSKLLLLAWDRGPAGDPIALSSFPRFFSTMAFSLHLKNDNPTPVTAKTVTSEGSTIKSSSHGDSDVDGLIRRKSMAAGDKRLSTRSSSSELEGEAGRKDSEKRSPLLGCSFVAMLVTSRKAQIVVLRSVFYYIASASSIRLLLIRWKPQIPESLIYVVYFFSIYFTCLFIFEAAAGVPALIFGFQLHPQFDMPFLATSLSEFWGRRWNRLVNNLLRASVYEPILQLEKSRKESVGGGVGALKPSREARAVRIFACFLVSGIMHEMILFYLMRTRPTFEMTGFFVVHGVGVILEMLVMKSKLWPRNFRLPTFVRWVYTMGFVYVTSVWLFFAPIERHGIVDATMLDLGRFFDWIEQMII